MMFFMIGIDKFLEFLQPPCSLQASISPIAWQGLGVLLISCGILLWSPKYSKHIAGFWAVAMLIFSIIHLIRGTYDIGGAVFLAVLLGLLVWSPEFILSKQKG